MSRSIKDDLEALPNGDLPTTWPFYLPLIGPANYVSISLPPLHIPSLVTLPPDAWPADRMYWEKEPLSTIEGYGLGNPYGNPGVGKGYPTVLAALPYTSIIAAGWTGWCHNTEMPRGTYRWCLGNASYMQNASDIEVNVTGLCCDGPEGDSAGIYFEHGNGAGWYYGLTGYFGPGVHPMYPVVNPAVVRIQGAGGAVIATIPWPALRMGGSTAGYWWYEAVITDTSITLRAFQTGGSPFSWQEILPPLVWYGAVPRGNWTQNFLYSNRRDYEYRNRGGTVTWLDIIPYATPGWMVGQIGWAGNGDEGETVPPP